MSSESESGTSFYKNVATPLFVSVSTEAEPNLLFSRVCCNFPATKRKKQISMDKSNRRYKLVWFHNASWPWCYLSRCRKREAITCQPGSRGYTVLLRCHRKRYVYKRVPRDCPVGRALSSPRCVTVATECIRVVGLSIGSVCRGVALLEQNSSCVSCLKKLVQEFNYV